MGTGRPPGTGARPAARVLATAATAVTAVALVSTLTTGCTGERSTDERAPQPPPANSAFIDVEATRAVSEQIAPAVERFFSYDYRRLDEHMSQTMADTTSRYWTAVEPSLRIVRDVAPAKQVVADAKVVATSVHDLQPSRAQLLLFVDRSTTERNAEPQREASSVVVTAVRTGPNWKIDGMSVS